MARFASSPPPEVLKLKEAAALIRVCAPTLVKMAEAGEIPYRMVGREYRFGRESLLRWINGDRAA